MNWPRVTALGATPSFPAMEAISAPSGEPSAEATPGRDEINDRQEPCQAPELLPRSGTSPDRPEHHRRIHAICPPAPPKNCAPPAPPRGPPVPEPALAVPARLPQESSDGRI